MANEQQPNLEGGEQHMTDRRPETEPDHQTKIYVASLSDYNDGELHGEWIDASQSAEQLHELTAEMLARSRHPNAEEWAIHDHEGFGPLNLSEHTSFDTISRIACGVGDYGQPFAHWADLIGTTADADLDKFGDSYLGEYKSVQDYGEHILDDLGYTDEIMNAVPEHLHPYVNIDSDGFGRDLELSGDIYASDSGRASIYLFDMRW